MCRREGINPNLYYKWSKEFLNAGKRRLLGDTKYQATYSEVVSKRRENIQLKELVADLSLKNVVLKKAWVVRTRAWMTEIHGNATVEDNIFYSC